MTQKRRGPAKAQATMVEINTSQANKEQIPADAWWAFIFPSQEAAPAPVPVGRYGYWSKEPIIEETAHGWIVNPVGGVHLKGEPMAVVSSKNAISVYVAQMKHASANPEPEITT